MKISENTIGAAIAVVFVAIGFGLIVMGIGLYQQRAELLAAGQRATGVIISFERVGPGPEGHLADKHRVPVVRYRTASGQEVDFRGRVAEPWWSNWQAGQEVAVVYLPDDPTHANIDTFADIWFAPLMLWLVGAGAAILPPLTLWRHTRHHRDAKW